MREEDLLTEVVGIPPSTTPGLVCLGPLIVEIARTNVKEKGETTLGQQLWMTY
jgi:hypothetical protein